MEPKIDCVILGAAPILNKAALLNRLTGNEFLICADGGLDHAAALGLTPNLIVGDFDSANLKPPQGVETVVLPCRKDDTDLQFAAAEGVRRGFRSFLLAGVTGGARPEHTVAAYCTMAWLGEHGKSVTATNGVSNYYFVSGCLQLQGLQNSYLSVFPFGGPAHGVCITGASYPLQNGTLTPNYPLGVSNEVTAPLCTVSVKQGALLVITTPKQLL